MRNPFAKGPDPKRGILALYEDPDALLRAATVAREHGFAGVDAYTPYAVHGLSEALGIRKSWVPFVTLVMGLSGAALGLTFEIWASSIDWPINVGGKPFVSLPAFIPITFETTVLGAALATVFGMLALNGLPMPYHPVFNVPRFALSTRNRFFLCIEATDPLFDREHTRRFLERLVPRQVSEVDH